MSETHQAHYDIFITFFCEGRCEIVKSLGSFDFSANDKVPKEVSDYLMRDMINLGLYNNNKNGYENENEDEDEDDIDK